MRGKSNGYGYCLFDGKYGGSHRVAWRLSTGDWPKNVVHHLCGNRACVRFEHLQEVTKTEHAHIHFGSLTHCPQGHAYEGHNLIVYHGARHCRRCVNDKSNAYQKKKRQARGPILPVSHCKKGHKFDEANTRLYRGKRICRACERKRKQEGPNACRGVGCERGVSPPARNTLRRKNGQSARSRRPAASFRESAPLS